MNPQIEVLKTEVLSDNWYTLRKVTYRIQKRDGSWETQRREAYDRGNGATILLYDRSRGTVLLTRQFRLPTYVNGNDSGMLIEACAGLLDDRDPAEAIRRETEEETGYRISEPRKIAEIFMSPGSVTEKLFFFVAEYQDDLRVNEGGGLVEDGEDITVLEVDLDEALQMIERGEVMDGKTIILLQYAALHHLMD